ncbi:flagellar basal body rod protein [Ornithinibacillus gellani]|uniref:lmo0954 family membrane protein n=1 Tax=Ornithinibacillus gellani TaxID=2293253 RepID=UPI000F46919F|nr:flagellar basal body rod protein [Ornithinibacillus gellani]TQS74749.1 flagellar basal body rod protein [Ornithinibacillus gellani]
MKKFMLFVGGLVALLLLLVNIGPMIFLGLGIWLLYVVFKKFVRSDSTAGKIGWVLVGLFVLSIVLSNMYAVIGIAAAYVLYLIYQSWKKDKDMPSDTVVTSNDPFTNFEREWAELNH